MSVGLTSCIFCVFFSLKIIVLYDHYAVYRLLKRPENNKSDQALTLPEIEVCRIDQMFVLIYIYMSYQRNVIREILPLILGSGNPGLLTQVAL